MTTAPALQNVATTPLPTDAITLLEAVLTHGALDAQQQRTTQRLDATAFDRAVIALVRFGLIQIRQSQVGTIEVRAGRTEAIEAFLGRHRGLAAPQRRLLQSYIAMRQAQQASTSSTGVDRVEDFDEMIGRLDDLARRCTHQSISVHPIGAPPTVEQLESSLADDLAMRRRGIDLRVVNPDAYRDLPGIDDSAAQLTAAGIRIRFVASTPHRMIVVDGKTAVIPIDPHRAGAGALFVTEPLLVNSLHFLANTLFQHGIPWAPAIGADDRPSATELRVLELMNSGVTDAVASKKLGVTDRQFRRYVAGIQERLGATSRFQVGVRALERGWL